MLHLSHLSHVASANSTRVSISQHPSSIFWSTQGLWHVNSLKKSKRILPKILVCMSANWAVDLSKLRHVDCSQLLPLHNDISTPYALFSVYPWNLHTCQLNSYCQWRSELVSCSSCHLQKATPNPPRIILSVLLPCKLNMLHGTQLQHLIKPQDPACYFCVQPHLPCKKWWSIPNSYCVNVVILWWVSEST